VGGPPSPTCVQFRAAKTDQREPATTPVVASLGLPDRYLEPRMPHPPPPELTAVSETDKIPASPITPVTHSPSISIATFSDFTIADVSDDESPADPAISETSNGQLPPDPAVAVPHDTFYLEDGNVEVLCGNTLFRIHTSVVSFRCPALSSMFSQTNLASAESPNGYRRIPSSDTATDFTTIPKIIYLLG